MLWVKDKFEFFDMHDKKFNIVYSMDESNQQKTKILVSRFDKKTDSFIDILYIDTHNIIEIIVCYIKKRL